MKDFKNIDEVLTELNRLVSLVEDVKEMLEVGNEAGGELRDKITSFTYGIDNFVARRPSMAIQLQYWGQHAEEQEEDSLTNGIITESDIRGLHRAHRLITEKLRRISE